MWTYIIALGLVLMASGCATVLDGGSQAVTFNSQPNGVRIFINGAQVGVTPLATQVKRTKNLTVVAKKDGYQEQQFILQTKTNTYFWFNAFWLGSGLFSSTTDWASDAMIEYSPNMYFFNLEPLKFSEPQNEQSSVGLTYERRIRNFILRNHANLTIDIARGNGDYLSSLYSLLGLEGFEYGLALSTLKVLSSRNREALSFAEAVLAQFPQDGSFYPNKNQQGSKARKGRR